LITGIGFIGGGAILKEGASVHGTATAASIWNTGAIGAAVAFGRYEIAIVLSFINFVTFRWLTPIKDALKSTDEMKSNDDDEPGPKKSHGP
jgi:putative Mg2+ transporter-C (MgtC) family protein